MLVPEVADQSALRASSAEAARAEWEERAAIREYDGGMSRAEAEALTDSELGRLSHPASDLG